MDFCVLSGYHYRVTVVVSDGAESIRYGGDRGSLSVQLHGDIQSSPTVQLTSEQVVDLIRFNQLSWSISSIRFDLGLITNMIVIFNDS